MDRIAVTDETGPDWRHLADHEALAANGRLMRRVDGRQIVLFLVDGEVYACNNLCPHEGYPLSEGTIGEDCVLTCNWHNWKFDLRSGDNLYEGDRLRTYPVELRRGEVWVDLADPPLEQRRDDALRQLRNAFDDNRYDRLARELARFRRCGGTGAEALTQSILWSWDRLEYGWTHAYAGMADWLTLHGEVAGDEELELACLLEAIGHVAHDVERQNHYAFGGQAKPQAWDEESFLAAVQREDERAAEGMVSAALAAGMGFADFEHAFTRAALAHYNSFGHSLIYLTKAAELVEALGEAATRPLLLSLVREFCFATREDLIPEFRPYAQALAAWGDKGASAEAPRAADYWKHGIQSCLDLTVAHSAAPSEALYEVLLEACGRNMLGFDLACQQRHDVPISANVSWLDFTHGITFAHALRRQCRRFPEFWPQGLLQLALFAGRNARFTLDEAPLDDWRVDAPEQFLADAIERLFQHGLGEFIVSVHWLKTTLAVREELQRGLGAGASAVLPAALNRFLNSPLSRRNPRRVAHQALQFVRHE